MSKRKTQSLTIKQKLEIIEELENGVKPVTISLQYGIPKQTISDIKRSKEKFLKYASESDNSRESTQCKKAGLERKRIQYGKSEKLEEAVMKWYQQQVGVGVGVRGIELKNASKRLGAQMGMTNFTASDG